MLEAEKNVLIIGGGFGGLNCAKKLGNKKGIKVTLLDKHNYHLFQPLLYQVATAGLNAADIAVPFRTVLSKYKNISIFLGEAKQIDAKNKLVETEFGEISFDYLVLACGATHSYFGKNAWEDAAPGLKTIEQAIEIRRRIFSAFEFAERESDLTKKQSYMTFVIVGGGATGVEMAGAISEISKYTLKRNFKNIDPAQAKIILVEAGPRVLQGFAPELSERTDKDLRELGVEIRYSSKVSELRDNGVWIGEQFISARTILWAAGVEPSPLGEFLGATRDPQGRVVVERDLSIKTYSNIFVIGDQAHFAFYNGKPLPGQAPVAIQQGICVANNILREMELRERLPFKYFDKGQMATIGRKKAVAEFANFKFGGTLAWFAWLFVHIYYVIGFKNRLFVLIQWAISYFTYSKGARLILSRNWKKEDDHP